MKRTELLNTIAPSETKAMVEKFYADVILDASDTAIRPSLKA